MSAGEKLVDFVSRRADNLALSRATFESRMEEDLALGIPANAGYLAIKGCYLISEGVLGRIEQLLTPEAELQQLYKKQDLRQRVGDHS